MIEQSHN